MFPQKLKQFIVKVDLSRLNPLKWKWRFDKKVLKKLLIITICFFFLWVSYFIVKNYSVFSDDQDVGYQTGSSGEESKSVDCNVTGIELHGNLLTYFPPTDFNDAGEIMEDEVATPDILFAIRNAENNDKIKAIILEIDSGGGSPVAGEEISEAIKKARKPIIVFIREIGASAAYLAATSADRIFASKYSEVGGIGVTMSYLDNAGQNTKDGLFYNSLSAGKFKDSGSANKKLTQEERVLFMRDINIMHQYFIKTVVENRNLDIEKVKKLADGSTMLGQAALENGLIDQIGGYYEARDYLKEKIGEDVEVCW